MRIQREIMSRVPEVKGMMARAGADELGIDPVGLNETDNFLTLAPQSEWRGKDMDLADGRDARACSTAFRASPTPSRSRSTCACRK